MSWNEIFVRFLSLSPDNHEVDGEAAGEILDFLQVSDHSLLETRNICYAFKKRSIYRAPGHLYELILNPTALINILSIPTIEMRDYTRPSSPMSDWEDIEPHVSHDSHPILLLFQKCRDLTSWPLSIQNWYASHLDE